MQKLPFFIRLDRFNEIRSLIGSERAKTLQCQLMKVVRSSCRSSDAVLPCHTEGCGRSCAPPTLSAVRDVGRLVESPDRLVREGVHTAWTAFGTTPARITNLFGKGGGTEINAIH